MFKFYKMIHEWSSRKMHDAWMETNYHDRACPCCNIWFSVTESWPTYKKESDTHDSILCLNCKTKTYYDMTGFMPAEDKDYIPNGSYTQ